MSEPKKRKTVDVGAQQVAAVYARALLASAEKAGLADSVVADYGHIVDEMLSANPRFEAVMASQLVDHEDKVKIIDRVFSGRVAPLLVNFFKILSQHGRLELLRAVQAPLVEAFDKLRGRMRVDVITATPLSAAAAEPMKVKIAQLIGGQPRMVLSDDPEIIGGVVLRVGDTVFDGSVATQLQAMRHSLVNRTVHEIQSGRDRFRHSGGN